MIKDQKDLQRDDLISYGPLLLLTPCGTSGEKKPFRY